MPPGQTTPTELRFPTREECVLPELLATRAAATPDKPLLLFENETWTYGQAAREAWRAANGLREHCGVEMGDYVSVWVPTSPDVLRAWFGTNAAGGVYAPLNLSARGSYLEHTMRIAESKVLIAHRGLVERLAGLDLPALETVVLVGGDADVDLPWRDDRPRGAARRRVRGAAGAAAAGRAVGRPQPDLHLRHHRPVERRPRRACRLLELRQLLHREVRRRDRPVHAAAADVLHGRHRHHVLDAARGRLGRIPGRLQHQDLLGRRAPLRGDDHDPDPRHGQRHARPAAVGGRRRQPAAHRLHGSAPARERVRRALRRLALHRIRHERGARCRSSPA